MSFTAFVHPADLSDLYADLINMLAGDARALADTHGYTEAAGLGDERNAIEHAHVSAQLALEHGDLAAIMLGGMKEIQNLGVLNQLDTKKDLYNNEVGRRIAKWVRLNGHSASAIDALILDALKYGDLVVSEDDPRINSEPSILPDWVKPNEWRHFMARMVLGQCSLGNLHRWRWFSDLLESKPPGSRSQALVSAFHPLQSFGDVHHHHVGRCKRCFISGRKKWKFARASAH